MRNIFQTFHSSLVAKCLLVVPGLMLSLGAIADVLSEQTYEVYFGDFNGDGKGGDVYFHRKDKFVLIFGQVSIPIMIASDGSYVVYEGDAAATSLKMSVRELSGYLKATLGDNYEFTDVNGDGVNEIVAAKPGESLGTVVFFSGNGGAPEIVINEPESESMGVPPSPQLATPNQFSGINLSEMDRTQLLGGNFRVSESGAALYNLPIKVPAGTAGVAPSISLSYSSEGGNGIAGLGWSIGGVGSIARCRRSSLQDGEGIGVLDKYCLNGMRLLVESGSYGSPGSTYRTEIDSGVIVTLESSEDAGEPDYFTMISKDGSTTIFGGVGEHDAEMIAFSSDANISDLVLAWKISVFRDSVGNSIRYTYNASDTGHVIDYIEYAYGNTYTAHAKVKFNYFETPREDPLSYYIGGRLVTNLKLLDSIATYNDVGSGLQEVNTYDLLYIDRDNYGFPEEYPHDDLSRVKTVRLCASGNCSVSVATNFSWGGEEVGMATGYDFESEQIGIETGYTFLNMVTPDLDGDGRLDIVWGMVKEEGTDSYAYRIYSKPSAGNSRLVGQINTDTPVKSGIQLVDLNLDGRADIVFGNHLFLAKPMVNGTWVYTASNAMPNLDTEHNMFVDVTGDGLVDQVKFNEWNYEYNALTSGGQADYDTNSFYKFSSRVTRELVNPESISQENDWYRIDGESFGDFNGDGIVDIAVILRKKIGELGTINVGGHPSGGSAYQLTRYQYEDYLALYAGTGSSFSFLSKKLLFSNLTGDAAAEDIYFASRIKLKPSVDVNGDGISDAIFSEGSSTDWSYMISNGLNFLDPVALNLGSYSIKDPIWVDYNRDGFLDVIWLERGFGEDKYRAKYKVWNLATNAYSEEDDFHDYSVEEDELFQIFDCTGDGILDVVKLTREAKQIRWWKGLHDIDKPYNDRIYSIVDNFGNETNIGYKQLIFSDRYTSLEGLTIDGSSERVCEDRPIPTYEGGTYQFCWTAVAATDLTDFYHWIYSPFRDLGDEDIKFGTERTAKVFDVAGSALVVTNVTKSNPHDGNLNAEASMDYSYERMRMQSGGRGVLGFKGLTTVDNQTGITTTTTYRQDWPFIGMPKSATVYSNPTKSVVLSESENSYYAESSKGWAPGARTKTADYGAIRVWASRSLESNYALSDNGAAQGVLLSTVVTEIDNDSENNIESMVVSTYAGGESGELVKRVSTENTYWPYDAGKFLGRLTNTSVTTYKPSAEEPSVTLSSAITYYGMNGSCAESGWLKGMICSEQSVTETRSGAITQHFYDEFGNEQFTYQTDPANPEDIGRYSAYREFDAIGRYLEKMYNLYNSDASDQNLPNYPVTAIEGVAAVNTLKVESRNRFGAVTESRSSVGTSWSTTKQYYSSYGVPYLSASSDGSYSLTLLSRASSLVYDRCPQGKFYFRTVYSSGGATTRTCYDRLGRAIQMGKLGFDTSRWIFTETKYDKYGHAYKKSEPYLQGNSVYWTEITNYDLLGRPLTTTLPMYVTDSEGNTSSGVQATSTFVYNDEELSQTYSGPVVIDEVGGERRQIKTEKRNLIGDLVLVEELDDGKVIKTSYEYDVFGKLTVLRDSSLNATEIVYDAFGNKKSMSDPDKGNWRYTYNGYNELELQIDANNQKILNCYDFLGRLIKRLDYSSTEPAGSCSIEGNYEAKAEWIFDAAENGLGQVVKELSVLSTSNSTITKTFKYDEFGRGSETATQVPSEGILQPGSIHYERVSYDQYGRVYQIFDSARTGEDFSHTGIKNIYNTAGYLDSVVNADENTEGTLGSEYYAINSMNARGQVTSASFDNGNVTTTTYYNARSGLPEQIHTFGALYQDIQLLNMKWDTVGNLAFREDLGKEYENGPSRNIYESFSYDGKNRLDSYTVNKNSTQQSHVTVNYDDLGNIQEKSDTGIYQYGTNAGPHALTSIGNRTFGYDHNGNMLSDGDRQFTYAVFNKIKKIVSLNTAKTTKFAYDANRVRFKRIDINPAASSGNGKVVTLYLGSVEKIFNSDSTQLWRRTIAGGAVQITHSFSNDKLVSKKTFNFHRDHLGSITAISTSGGQMEKSMAFDPWGQRRNPNSWQLTSNLENTGFFTYSKPITTIGFTGHEMVDENGIIHMNGRIYDPQLGRFLQADPHIQSPSVADALNRYSYVLNNPLNAVDPTGYFGYSLKDIYRASLRTSGIWETHRQLNKIDPGLASSVGALFSAIPVWGAFISAVYSANNTFYLTGSFTQSMTSGALSYMSSQAFKAIGQMQLGDAERILMHGYVGGAMSVAQGGKFEHGFISAGLTKAINVNDWVMADNIDFAGDFSRVIVAGLIGGTISEATGGKFANGAITAAIAQAFNGNHQKGTRQDAQKGSCPVDECMTVTPEDELVMWPTEYDKVTSTFSEPRGNGVHGALDLRAYKGSKIFSTQDGEVLTVNQNARGGNQIIILNDDGTVSGYAHTGALNGIKAGVEVYAGQQIGISDGSGTGAPHLHYTFRECQGCAKIDPMQNQLNRAIKL